MAGFPHSDIHGSILACSSPWLFAAYRVLLRLLAPRHPPYALSSLTSFLLSSHFRVPSLVTLSKLLFKRFLTLLFSFFYILFKVHEVLPSKLNNNQSECDRPEVCELSLTLLPRKEVIQPHLPIRLPCYDFTPIIGPTLDGWLLKGYLTGFGCYQLSWCDGRCVQGPGTYSPQYADLRLLAIPTSRRRVAACDPN